MRVPPLIERINRIYVPPLLSIWFMLTIFSGMMFWLTDRTWPGIISLALAKISLFTYIYEQIFKK